MNPEQLQNALDKAWIKYHSVVSPSKETGKSYFQKEFNKVVEKKYEKAIKS